MFQSVVCLRSPVQWPFVRTAYASITELAKAEGVNESYACRILRLSLLAPHIVTAILDGRHGSDVMLKDLMKPLPVCWDEQIAALKIADRA
jgi:hypothetical protein